jgi:serine phosphatase RsbU (regulator of sigma subunit)
MIKRFEFVLIIALFTLIFSLGNEAMSQEGNPFLTHYRLPDGVSNQNWGFVQGDNGLIYVLNRKGIFSFDGLQWENMGVGSRPIAIGFSNWLFFSSDKGIGFFQRNLLGVFQQRVLVETTESNYYYKFIATTSGLLAVSPQTILQITTTPKLKIDTVYNESRSEVFISDLFQINDLIYHVKNGALIYLHKSDGGFDMKAGLPFGEDMTFSFTHNNELYFGTTLNRLYSFNGHTIKLVSLKDQEYLDASITTGGVSVDNNQFALSTLNGGAVIINSKDGTTSKTLNYFNGLPDDEVFSLGMDIDGGMWISHGMGITRADLKIPVRSYSFYKGLTGNILSCIEFGNSFYVGTSEGLYLLDEVRDYKTVHVTIPQKKVAKASTPVHEEEKVVQKEETVQEKRKGFISRLFSRRPENTEEQTDLPKTEQAPTVQSTQTELPPIKRRIYELQSVSHAYKKVQGVDGKVRHLFKHNYKLYAATNFGLYEILGGKGKRVIEGKNIFFVKPSKFQPDVLLIGSDNGAYIGTVKNDFWRISTILEGSNHLINSIVQVDFDKYLVANEFDLLLATKRDSEGYDIKKIPIKGTEFSSPVVRKIYGKIMAFSSSGAFEFDPESNELKADHSFPLQNSFSILHNQPEYTWFKYQRQWFNFSDEFESGSIFTGYINLFDNPNYIYSPNYSTLYIVNEYAQVYKIQFDDNETELKPISIFINRILSKNGDLLKPDGIELDYNNNSLRIRISAPSYIKQGSVLFQYRIIGLMDDWSEWTSDYNLELPYFPTGSYMLAIKARDVLGNESKNLYLPFKINPPFWKTPLFYGIVALFIVIFLIFVIKYRERSLRKEKAILEQKVKERTKTIEEQNIRLTQQRDELSQYNKEILLQKEEIETQRDEIEVQRDKIFKQNDEITQSITYAQRIQAAVMPSDDYIKRFIENYFILFKPRDIVSGDFYWISEEGNRIVVVAADCTGHGVPGAFMSMMGVSFLNEIVNVGGETQPDIILNKLRNRIKTVFEQTGKERDDIRQDGMDVSICVFDKNHNNLQFAGAYNPLYIVRNGELLEHKSDKMPVGAHPNDSMPFNLKEINLSTGDIIYIFSDGFVSQFGGPKGRKFMAKSFKELLVAINGKTMAEQKIILEKTLSNWQGSFGQIDDILVIGVEV